MRRGPSGFAHGVDADGRWLVSQPLANRCASELASRRRRRAAASHRDARSQQRPPDPSGRQPHHGFGLRFDQTLRPKARQDPRLAGCTGRRSQAMPPLRAYAAPLDLAWLPQSAIGPSTGNVTSVATPRDLPVDGAPSFRACRYALRTVHLLPAPPLSCGSGNPERCFLRPCMRCPLRSTLAHTTARIPAVIGE